MGDIGNMDQTPIPYEFLNGTFYDFKGVETIWVKETRSGWDKRCATLMVYVAADGFPYCRPLLIFKGTSGPKNTTIRFEMRRYDERVRVQWNPKAYCNSEVMVKWLKEQYAFATPIFFNRKKPHPRLLSLDVFSA